MDRVDQLPIWQELIQHSEEMASLRIENHFANNANRFKEFSLETAGIFLDYSKNQIVKRTMDLLLDLAHNLGIIEYRDRMFQGEKINSTEKRAVLHTLLRSKTSNVCTKDEESLISKELEKMKYLVNSVRNGAWQGYSSKNITDIVHIGIGGSNLGPAMVVNALTPYSSRLKIHFVSNLDATHIVETLRSVNHETTLFLVASKTFTTQETLANAVTAKNWLLSRASTSDNSIIEKHFIGITSSIDKAVEFGIAENNILSFWDWVGGRFSLWSAIGVSIALAIGMENFCALLAGAEEMDVHFKTCPIEKNMPMILALIGVWNINFLNILSNAIVPYDQYLSLLPLYLQQIEMESNGKNVNIKGTSIDYKTAPIVWGGVGTDSQHSFHQALMQGTVPTSVDFIIPLITHNTVGTHHLMLYANCIAQSRALMVGRKREELIKRLDVGSEDEELSSLAKHKVVSGSIPTNTIVIEKITPRILGALLALYEHKVFVQGAIWQINSFDQWGVELGKELANELLPILQGDEESLNLDSSTEGLVELYKKRSV